MQGLIKNSINIIKPRTKDEKDYITFGTSMVFTIIFIIFAIKPSVTRIFLINSQISELSDIRKILTDRTDSLTKLKPYYANGGYELLESAVPNDPDESYLLSKLTEAQLATNVILVSISFQDTESPMPGFRNLDMTMAVAGNYNNVVNYANYFSRVLRKINVKTVHIENSEDFEGTGIVQATIDATAYYKK